MHQIIKANWFKGGKRDQVMFFPSEGAGRAEVDVEVDGTTVGAKGTAEGFPDAEAMGSGTTVNTETMEHATTADAETMRSATTVKAGTMVVSGDGHDRPARSSPGSRSEHNEAGGVDEDGIINKTSKDTEFNKGLDHAEVLMDERGGAKRPWDESSMSGFERGLKKIRRIKEVDGDGNDHGMFGPDDENEEHRSGSVVGKSAGDETRSGARLSSDTGDGRTMSDHTGIKESIKSIVNQAVEVKQDQRMTSEVDPRDYQQGHSGQSRDSDDKQNRHLNRQDNVNTDEKDDDADLFVRRTLEIVERALAELEGDEIVGDDLFRILFRRSRPSLSACSAVTPGRRSQGAKGGAPSSATEAEGTGSVYRKCSGADSKPDLKVEVMQHNNGDIDDLNSDQAVHAGSWANGDNLDGDPTKRQTILNLYPPGRGIKSHVDLKGRYEDGIVGVCLGSGVGVRFDRVMGDGQREEGREGEGSLWGSDDDGDEMEEGQLSE